MYDLPDAAALANDLRRVPLLVSTAERVDETASLAHFVCPDHHYLESWSDAEPISGVVSLTQPAIQPLKDTRALIESLSAWGTEPAQPALDLVRAHWERAVYPRAGASDPFQAFWNKTLERGAAEIAPRPVTTKPFDASAVRAILRSDELPSSAFALGAVSEDWDARRTARPQCVAPRTAGSGDEGHLGQLRLLVAGRRAQRLGIEDGDVVRIAAADGGPPLELPAFVQPGQHDATVAIALGYGRAGTDRFARVGPPWFEARAHAGVVGVNASALVGAVDGTRQYSGRAVTVVKTGRRQELASTQIHHSLAAPANLAALAGSEPRPDRAGSDAGGAGGVRSPSPRRTRARAISGLPIIQYHGHRWGMAVDLELLHRLFGLRDRVSVGEQRPGGRSGRSAPQPRDALDPDRSLLLRQRRQP